MTEYAAIQTSLEQISDCTDSEIQELNEAKEFYKIIRNKYRKYKILYDAVEDSMTNGTKLDANLKSKVEDVVLSHRVGQVFHLNSESSSLYANNVLGMVTERNVPALSYNQSSQLRTALETSLRVKYKTVREEFYKLSGKNLEAVSSMSNEFGDFGLNRCDSTFLELKRKVEEEQRKYFHNLLEEFRLLEDLVKLRLAKVPEMCETGVFGCKIKLQMERLQTRIIQERSRILVFTETNNSLKAYEELIKDIEMQQLECKRDIDYLQELKRKYEDVACKEYDELLKLFVQYEVAIEKKKQIYESLGSLNN